MADQPVIGKRVLVVEDDTDIQEVLTQVLELEGYEVIVADNGLKALERLNHSKTPDLIILDMMMPVMDGWEFRAKQREDPRLADIPVVILSANGSIQQRTAFLGAAGFLKKPVELETLLHVVNEHCL